MCKRAGQDSACTSSAALTNLHTFCVPLRWVHACHSPQLPDSARMMAGALLHWLKKSINNTQVQKRWINSRVCSQLAKEQCDRSGREVPVNLGKANGSNLMLRGTLAVLGKDAPWERQCLNEGANINVLPCFACPNWMDTRSTTKNWILHEGWCMRYSVWRTLLLHGVTKP